MKALFDFNNLKLFPGKEILSFECSFCKKIFSQKASRVRSLLKAKRTYDFCSAKCSAASRRLEQKINCTNCQKDITVKLIELKRSKTGRMFCSHSCSATYNNTHKTSGTRRSKLERWIEENLKILYPNLEMDFNKHDAIDSELDIYIPSLKLAFELNGIFHYEPIYGDEKLEKIKNNDDRKFQACIEKGIGLTIIDSSIQKRFKESTSIQFLNIITNIINLNLKKD